MHESENDPVDFFPEDQLYVVFVFADGGADLERFELRSFEESQSILLQVSLCIRVDHTGNVVKAKVPYRHSLSQSNNMQHDRLLFLVQQLLCKATAAFCLQVC